MRHLGFPTATLRRLQLLLERDRLVHLVRTLPYGRLWLDACADLTMTERLLASVQQQAA